MAIPEEPITLVVASCAAETRQALRKDLSERRQRAQRQQHWTMFILAMVVVAVACLLHVTPTGEVALGCVLDRAWPRLCLFREICNRPCPGCGLTRSFVFLVHGDWQSAWQMHRLGWLLLAAVVAQFPYRVAALLAPNRQVLGVRFPTLFGYMLIALLILNWIPIFLSGSP